MSKIKVLYIGSLNTDIFIQGVSSFPNPGEHVYGTNLKFAAGGKSRNAAHMTANLMDSGAVAMAGVTVKDDHGLYKVPLEALKAAGVDIGNIVVEEPNSEHQLPGIAVITVDESGENRIIVIPGISHTLDAKHIDVLLPIFEKLANNGGYLCLGLEAPLEAVVYAKELASKMGIRIVLDPGGIKKEQDYSQLIDDGLYAIKPNEHEAGTLTGVKVIDEASAKEAAKKIQAMGVGNVLITLGAKGAFLLAPEEDQFIEVPDIKSADKDSTGCGDQALAGFVSTLAKGKSVDEAARVAVTAGTLQFGKPGIEPLTKTELNAFLD